ncbi:hypothetical protein [Nannocystis punicea]|uniref:Uncharacterized protein n=1 Tax=Nannocystis punicea TaxID=2995304 RepID=A0ABY7GSU4_9BACT|nr:hypothetical protein [Nannocystis poenicansa]WAS90029.1 hypothetical protein O0S08_27865 [Nannocystis poenicansa]
MQPNLLDFVSAPTLINTVLVEDAICPLVKQAVVIPVFVAVLALILLAVRARHGGRPVWFDKLAVVTLLLLAVLTKPDRSQHLTALREADALSDPVLIHGDYLFVSATTGDATVAVGVFGRVFVFQLERSP